MSLSQVSHLNSKNPQLPTTTMKYFDISYFQPSQIVMDSTFSLCLAIWLTINITLLFTHLTFSQLGTRYP